MNISISTYQVKKGDTLQSVAEELGISAEALKRYHNTYCDLKNLIGVDLKGIQEVIIPSKNQIAELKEVQKQLSYSEKLPSLYLNKTFYYPTYEVTESIETLGQEDIKINYSTAIKLNEISDRGFIAIVNNSDFKKKGQSPDDKISMLSLACMESISPVAFLVPVQGKLKGFYEHKTLVKKFENKRADLESFFIGDINKAYFDKFYSNITKENYLLKQFCSTLLYQVLFPEMDWFRRKKEWEEEFFIIQNSFPVNCRFITEYNFENPENVEIIIKGEIKENCSLQELLRGLKLEEEGAETLSGDVELKYTTHKLTKQLQKVEAEVILWHEDEQYNKHTLLLIAKQEEEKPKKKYNTLVDK